MLDSPVGSHARSPAALPTALWAMLRGILLLLVVVGEGYGQLSHFKADLVSAFHHHRRSASAL
jgi:hypothetical protein